MARVTKKVKIKKPRTKKFWIILSSIIAAVVILATTITLILVLKKESKYEPFKDIEDAKISYNDIKKKASNLEVDNMFVFVYDDSFDPEDNTTDKDMEIEIILLYKKVKEYNESFDPEFEFYLVDTSKSKNKGILVNGTFGELSESNALIYLFGGKSATYPSNIDPEKADADDYKDQICGKTKQEVKQAIGYIEYLKNQQGK